jgi:hypothetical protein
MPSRDLPAITHLSVDDEARRNRRTTPISLPNAEAFVTVDTDPDSGCPPTAWLAIAWLVLEEGR